MIEPPDGPTAGRVPSTRGDVAAATPLAIPDAAPHPLGSTTGDGGRSGFKAAYPAGMAGTVLDDPRPVLVLHDGVWVPGRLLAYRRDASGWRGMVRYRVDLSQYLHWREEAELWRAR